MREATDVLATLGQVTGTELSAREALAAIINEFGGYDAWAKEVALDMEAADRGSGTRVNLHKMVLTGLLRFGDDITDDDLDTEDQIDAIVNMKLAAMQQADKSA